MKVLFLILFLVPFITFAQTEATLTIGDRTVTYDNMVEVSTGKLYYQNNTLVASEHSETAFIYENDRAVLEAHDTNGDDVLDAFVVLTADGQAGEATGPEAARFTRSEPKEFAELLAEAGRDSVFVTAGDDLVGSLDRIEIPHTSSVPWVTIILWLIIIVVGIFWWLQKKSRTYGSVSATETQEESVDPETPISK